MPLVFWKGASEDQELQLSEAHEYKSLSQDEASSTESKSGGSMISHSKVPKYVIVGNTLLFIVSACLLGSAFYVARSHSAPDCETELSRHTSFFSPALDTVMPQWGPQLHAQHPLESNESIWRQSPSDAVDQAWGRITDVAMLEITRDQVLKLGKDPTSSVRTPPEWIDGEQNEDRYLAIVDGMHLLHCLNSMRKSLYHNYHHYFPDGYPSSYGAHLSHCQETLALWLMCQPSIEFVSFGWYEKREPPFPDFDITRKCVNFEQLLDWQNEHRIEGLTKPMFDALRPPDDLKRRVAPVMYDEILGHTWDEVLDSAERLTFHDGCKEQN
ncbi:hypothetical protein F4679DRAFT_598439 [Xylaria curta]|nr:hypothetical protein F4679DRAFT_598439 [Xylaria curta]